MKVITLLLLFIAGNAFVVQTNYPVAKLYAYKQLISGGSNSTFDKSKKQGNRYYIYLLVKQKRNIQIKDVWIAGLSVPFTTQEVNSPVSIDAGVSLSGKSSTQQLVPETKHVVLQIAVENLEKEEAISIPKAFKQYHILVQYTEADAVFYVGAKNFKPVAANANQ